MAIADDDDGFGDFIFAPPPPLNLQNFIRPESSGIATSMAPNFVQDDDWGDFFNSSGAGGFSHAASSLPIPSDLFGIPVAGNQHGVTKKKPLEMKPSGAFPLSLFGEMEEEAAGEESGDGLKNSDPVKKNSAVNIDVNDLISDLYKPNGDSKPNGSAREERNGLDSSWSWGHTSGFGNGLIANGTNGVKSESRGHGLDFDPLNLTSNGSNLNGNMSGSILQGSNLNSNSNSNVVNGNEGFDVEEDDDGWEFKAAEYKVEEIAKPEQMTNQNGLTFNPNELYSSWNGANLDFSGWSTSSNGVEQSSNSMNDGSVGEREDLPAIDTWGLAVAGSNGILVDKIKKIDKTTENVSNENFDKSSLSWDVVQFSESNGLASSLSGLNSNVVQADPGSLDENDEFSDVDGWAFKDPESDMQDTQVKMEDDLKIQSIAADSSVKISNLGGAGVNLDLFAADWDTREGTSDMTQSDHNLLTETEDPDGDDDWEFKIAESESGPIDSSSKVHDLTHSRSTGALPLSLFGEEEKDANDLALQEVSSARISRNDNRGLSSSLSLNDLISSLYNEVEQTASPSHLQNQGENQWGPSETALASSASNGTEVLDDDTWEFKDASSIPVQEQTSISEDSTIWSSHIELPDWVDLFSKLKEELYLIAYQHLENIKRTRETAALTREDTDLSVLDREIQDLHDELGNIAEEVHSEDHLQRDVRLSELFEVLQQPKFQAIETEYQLLEKLSLVQNDSKSTVQLLKKVFSVLKILTLVFRQEQSSYTSTWSKILSLCAEELRYGSMIWKQLVQENIQEQVLSRVEGKRYILALGEIYRLVEVLRCTARLYRPWILLMGPADSARFNTVMSECSTMWSSSGLEEALLSISDGSTILDSIAYLRNLEDATFYEIVFSGQGPICQLSALNQGVVPGMDLVAWNGAHYFVKLANLWTHLTGSDLPSLPHLHMDDV